MVGTVGTMKSPPRPSAAAVDDLIKLLQQLSSKSTALKILESIKAEQKAAAKSKDDANKAWKVLSGREKEMAQREAEVHKMETEASANAQKRTRELDKIASSLETAQTELDKETKKREKSLDRREGSLKQRQAEHRNTIKEDRDQLKRDQDRLAAKQVELERFQKDLLEREKQVTLDREANDRKAKSLKEQSEKISARAKAVQDAWAGAA